VSEITSCQQPEQPERLQPGQQPGPEQQQERLQPGQQPGPEQQQEPERQQERLQEPGPCYKRTEQQQAGQQREETYSLDISLSTSSNKS